MKTWKMMEEHRGKNFTTDENICSGSADLPHCDWLTDAFITLVMWTDVRRTALPLTLSINQYMDRYLRSISH